VTYKPESHKPPPRPDFSPDQSVVMSSPIRPSAIAQVNVAPVPSPHTIEVLPTSAFTSVTAVDIHDINHMRQFTSRSNLINMLYKFPMSRHRHKFVDESQLLTALTSNEFTMDGQILIIEDAVNLDGFETMIPDEVMALSGNERVHAILKDEKDLKCTMRYYERVNTYITLHILLPPSSLTYFLCLTVPGTKHNCKGD
jgi:hypothetical protein